MCVPVIAPDGSIKLGESALCPPVASIYDKYPYGKPQTDEVARGSGTESMAVRD